MSDAKKEPKWEATHDPAAHERSDKITAELSDLVQREIMKHGDICHGCTLNLLTIKLLSLSIFNSTPLILPGIIATAQLLASQMGPPPADTTKH